VDPQAEPCSLFKYPVWRRCVAVRPFRINLRNYFDEAIIRDERRFRQYLVASPRGAVRRTQFSVARSFAHDLVQCADLFAGFQNLKIRIALGEGKNRVVPGDFEDDEISLADLFEVSFRYVLWGQDDARHHISLDHVCNLFAKQLGGALTVCSFYQSHHAESAADYLPKFVSNLFASFSRKLLLVPFELEVRTNVDLTAQPTHRIHSRCGLMKTNCSQ